MVGENMINENNVYIKTSSGTNEMKSQGPGVLDRETRILLILINGSKNYTQLMKSLNDSKIFKEPGTFQEHFELLQDLQYIKLREESDKESSTLINFTERRDAIVLEKDDYGMGTMVINQQN